MKRGHVLAVVGAQYGSEGKGAIVSHLAKDYGIHVRTGAPNAGHSFWWKGKKWVMQSVPCGWTNPKAILILGRGGLINPKILLEEIKMVETVFPNIRQRIFIDPKAGCLDPRFHEMEGGVNGEAHKRIGSTGEGVGPARMARMNRKAEDFEHMEDVADRWDIADMMHSHTPEYIQQALKEGTNVLLEGTQGSGLSLIHGPWPYCTSNDTNASQMCADAGIPPHHVKKVIIVARTYPIRVAGNSGPLYAEMTWAELSARIGRPVEERTTVTKKVRRVGEWDESLIDSAITLNAPTSIAITFMDYLEPSMFGKRRMTEKAKKFVHYVERRFGTKVSMVGTGGQDAIIDLKEGI
jgi:adenylosuccinate synthase